MSTGHWTVASSAILHTSVSLNRQADAMPTGANGQDWLARSQTWLAVAIRNEAHTVSKRRGAVDAVPLENRIRPVTCGSTVRQATCVYSLIRLCVPRTSSMSCDQAIFVDHAADTGQPS